VYSVDWSLVVNLVAAIGSCSAAIVALVIATRDRRDRNQERFDAATHAAITQARLVVLDVRLSQSSPAFDVEIRNFGTEAVLDIELESAQFALIPTATPKATARVKVLDSDRSPGHLFIEFVDADGQSVITGKPDEYGGLVIDNAKPSDLDVTIRFMDSEGNHCRRWLGGGVGVDMWVAP
jgi:hypothetical protein